LARSHAGIRLIAMASIYNQGDFDRLKIYVCEHFNSLALQTESADSRVDDLLAQYRAVGRVRVRQVVAYDEHHVVVMLDSEQGHLLLEDLEVEADYPHKITAHMRQLVS
jgi:hypothetical protein